MSKLIGNKEFDGDVYVKGVGGYNGIKPVIGNKSLQDVVIDMNSRITILSNMIIGNLYADVWATNVFDAGYDYTESELIDLVDSYDGDYTDAHVIFLETDDGVWDGPYKRIAFSDVPDSIIQSIDNFISGQPNAGFDGTCEIFGVYMPCYQMEGYSIDTKQYTSGTFLFFVYNHNFGSPVLIVKEF